MVAKGALRRLAQSKQEPTPENYARAFAEESGQPLPELPDAKAQGAAWAALIERIASQVGRSGRQWTAARRRESLQRVLDSSRSDGQRLLQRLQSLLTAWDADKPADPVETGLDESPTGTGADAAGHTSAIPAAAARHVAIAPAESGAELHWEPLLDTLQGTLRAGLPEQDPRAAELADQLGELADAVVRDGATAPHVAAVAELCERIRRLFSYRHELVDQLAALCRELSSGMTEVSEDDSWAQGQCEGLRQRLGDGLSLRAVRAATDMLAQTRQHQHGVREERRAAREALKDLIRRMIGELDDLGTHTGRFHDMVGVHAQAVARADTVEELAQVVKALLADSQAINDTVVRSRQRLNEGQSRANELETRVRELEVELRRLSDEVLTDALTQVSNRRGLAQAFEAECARGQREAAAGQSAGLAVALIDIDNFKHLNDSLGHAAGDVALKTLAAAVRDRLRPVDHLARFGGEEFVVLLPKIGLDEAQQTLSRLQRSLSASLFMHEGKDVFVTFSAGVTLWQPGQTLEASIERADEALYEAKRTGKNRTCVA